MQIVILAGGSGTRLWPLSRQLFPKQFLSLIDNHSLIQNTALRVKDYPVHVVTSQETEFLIKNQLQEVIPTFTLDNIFSEPLARNTAPAMAYACQFFSADTVLAVLPADHHIKDTAAFLKLLQTAGQLAQKGHIVTFGITPHRPETGYGYIKTGAPSEKGAFKVEGFKEKPDLKTAEGYLKSGDYFWNSGMFVFSVKTMLEELRQHAPEIYKTAQAIGAVKPVKAETYGQFPSLSIDYAVMEKTSKLLLLPADIGWSDIGGFEALQELLPKDGNDNALHGEMTFHAIDSRNNLIFNYDTSKTLAVIGIQDQIIVHTPDALLISAQGHSQEVKQIVESLKKSGDEIVHLHKKVYRPWGFYKVLYHTPTYQVKEFSVSPGQRLSLQSHNHRSENWTVVSGKALITLDENEYSLGRGESIFIPQRSRHRVTNRDTKQPAIIIEVQMGDYLGEDDIVRYEDDYGRKS